MNMQASIRSVYSLEQLAGQDTVIHRLHPMVKLVSTLVCIITVVSFDRYDLGRLVPYIFYPTVLIALAGIPYAMLLRRFAVALPFCLFAGLSNVFFDRAPVMLSADFVISSGVVSFAAILFRTYLCVMAVLILAATTPVSELSNQLRRLHVPGMLVTMLEMTYRFLGTLVNEATSMQRAVLLRSGEKSKLEMRHMGSFFGQLLLRTLDRADRVYNAMNCRGYALSATYRPDRSAVAGDYLFLAVTCCLLIVFRLVDGPVLLSSLLGKVAT